MFKSSDIPSSYNRIAEVGDNYVVWVSQNKLNSGTSYIAYYQFFTPSFYVMKVDNYYIKDGSEYSVSASGDYDYSFVTMIPDDDYWGDTQYDRADFPQIFVCGFIILIGFIWVFKQLSRLFFKGGLC